MTPRHVVITGANTGIGFTTALALARQGMKLTLAGRSADKHAQAIAAIREQTGRDDLHFVQLDLGDLDSVRGCAGELLRRPKIDVLVNNAGLGGTRGATKQGFELAFGTNHLGHYLLTRLLIDHLADGARVVNVSSRMHENARSIDWDAVQRPTRTFTGLAEYSASKLANVLFTAELARRYEAHRLVACSVHPGRVATEVFRRAPKPLVALSRLFKPMITAEQGALTTLHCVTAPEIDHGGYFARGKAAEASATARDPELAGELWGRSASWVGLPA